MNGVFVTIYQTYSVFRLAHTIVFGNSSFKLAIYCFTFNSIDFENTAKEGKIVWCGGIKTVDFRYYFFRFTGFNSHVHANLGVFNFEASLTFATLNSR